MGLVGKGACADGAGEGRAAGYVPGAGQSYPPNLGCAELDPEVFVKGNPFEKGGAAVILVDPSGYVGGSQARGDRACHQVGAVVRCGVVAGAWRGGGGAYIIAGGPSFVRAEAE